MTKAEMEAMIQSLAEGQKQIASMLSGKTGGDVAKHVANGGKVTTLPTKKSGAAQKQATKQRAIPSEKLLNDLSAFFGDADYEPYSAKGGDATTYRFSGGNLTRDFYLPLPQVK